MRFMIKVTIPVEEGNAGQLENSGESQIARLMLTIEV